VKAVVTGGRGFVGRHLGRHLTELGVEVVSLDVGDVQPVDITDREAVARRIADEAPDVVFHLAAKSHVGESWTDGDALTQVNVGGTSAVVDACVTGGPMGADPGRFGRRYGARNPWAPRVVGPCMTDREIREPSAAHPITVEPTDRHVTVRVNGEVVAETDAALTLQESTYPAVQYIPLADVAAAALSRSDTTTYCPYKGDASYYDVTAAGDTIDDVIWTYEQPYPAVAGIAGHVAFYPDKADVVVG